MYVNRKWIGKRLSYLVTIFVLFDTLYDEFFWTFIGLLRIQWFIIYLTAGLFWFVNLHDLWKIDTQYNPQSTHLNFHYSFTVILIMQTAILFHSLIWIRISFNNEIEISTVNANLLLWKGDIFIVKFLISQIWNNLSKI